jgi:hypothetical protein
MTLLQALAIGNKGNEAIALFDSMYDKYSIVPLAAAYTARARALGVTGDWQEAVQLIPHMRQLTVSVVLYRAFAYSQVYAAATRACASHYNYAQHSWHKNVAFYLI